MAQRDADFAEYPVLIGNGLKRWDTTYRQRKKLAAVIGQGALRQDLYLSDMPARKKLSRLLQKHGRRRLAQTIDGEIYFMTFAEDCGVSSDRTPYIALKKLRGKVDRAARMMGISMIAMMEIQPIMNHPQKGKGRTLLLNVHAIAIAKSKKKMRLAMEKINKSRAWKVALGILPVHRKKAGRTKADARRMFAYMAKVPTDAKNLMPNNRKPGRHLLMSTKAGYRPELALRIHEALSQIRICDVLFTSGPALRAVRTAVKRDLVSWHKARLETHSFNPIDFDAAELWKELRKENGSKHFQPFVIV